MKHWTNIRASVSDTPLPQRFKRWFSDSQQLSIHRLNELYYPDARQQGPDRCARGLSQIEEQLEARLHQWGHYRTVFLDQSSSGSGVTYLKWDLHLSTHKGPLTLRGVTQLHHDDRILYQEDFYDPRPLEGHRWGRLRLMRPRRNTRRTGQ